MKNFLLLMMCFFCISLSSYAQKDKKDNDKDKELISAETSNEIDGDTYNQWSLEFDLGQSKGSKPYTDGYYASDADKFLGGFQLNHYG